MQYRENAKRDLRQIANALGVMNVLEGTVRRAANRVRVSIELVEARNDSTIWADSYDRDLTDIFAIQSEIAQTIAHKLTATLSPSEQELIEQKPTENLAAYDLYLKAKALITKAELSWQIVNPTQLLTDATDFLNQAVKTDPTFTLSYLAASHAHDLLYISTDRTPARRALGDTAIQAALHLQPDLPDVHLAYAYHLYFCYRDFEQARRHLEMAKADLPNNPQAIELQAFMDRRQGHFKEAVNGIKAALALDPQNTQPLSDLAFTFWAMRQFRDAGEVYDRLINLVPDQPSLLDRKEDANREIENAVSMLPIEKDPLDGPCVLANSAVVHAWTGAVDKAFTELDVLAKIPRGVYYGQLKQDPLWDPLRKDPRFEKLLAELAPKE